MNFKNASEFDHVPVDPVILKQLQEFTKIIKTLPYFFRAQKESQFFHLQHQIDHYTAKMVTHPNDTIVKNQLAKATKSLEFLSKFDYQFVTKRKSLFPLKYRPSEYLSLFNSVKSRYTEITYTEVSD